MRNTIGLTIAGLLIGFGASAMVAQQQPTRVRGTIESVHGNTLAIKSYEGKRIDVMLQSGTKYAWVVPSNLSDIKKGDFLGTATTGPRGNMRALEVVIFPDSMRGTGEGHYDWSMPSAVVRADTRGSGSMTNGTMTNGTMTNGTMTNGTMTNGTMTNGTMTNGTMTNGTMTNGTMTNGTMTNGTMTNGTAANGTNGRMLTLSYGNNQHDDVMVPPGVPVVRFVPSERSILSPGVKVFILASQSTGKLDANFVAAGKNGLMPPM